MTTYPTGAGAHPHGLSQWNTWNARPAPAAIVGGVTGTRIDPRLAAHLRAWLGAWPPRGDIDLVVWPGRDRPAWNNGTWPVLGVESPDGTVLSLAPSTYPSPVAVNIDPARVAAALTGSRPDLDVPAALARPGLRFGRAVLRWAEQPVDLPEIGEWLEPDDARLPAWLRVFNGGALVAWDMEGHVAAGVGIKRHNPFGHELAVATEPAQRGRGLARLLVAQAAKRVMASGAIPLYLHAPENLASARVADSTGFPDRGWHLVELS